MWRQAAESPEKEVHEIVACRVSPGGPVSGSARKHMVTIEVEENDHESALYETAGGGDPTKSDRLSVGAAKKAFLTRGSNGMVREAMPQRPLDSDRHAKTCRSTANKRFSRELRSDP